MKQRRTSADGRFRRIAPSERRGLPYGKWIATGVVAVLLILAALFGSGGWLMARQEAAAVAELGAELEVAEIDLSAVRDRTEALVEPAGFELERLAREEYRMHADGDEVIHLVPATTGSAEPDGSR